MKNRVKNILNYKKPAFWIVCAAVIIAAAGAVLLTANPAQTLELPGTASVFTVEMEQFNYRLSIGRVVITDAEQIETILSAMAGAKKTLGRSVNDYPTQEKYLVVRLIMENEMRTLCLYSEGGGEYIEEPYIGIYKTRGNLGEVLYRVYTDNMDRTSGSAINIKWEASDDVPQPVRNYAADYVREQIEYYNSLGYNITDAKITSVTHVNTGTASLTTAVGMWRLEYRLLPDDAGKVVLAGGMKIEDGWLTEWGSVGQPYLVLVCDDTGTEPLWQRICVTNTDVIKQEYGTPEMLKQYGNEFTAAAMELYRKSLEIRTIGQVPAVYTRKEELGHTAVQKVAELLMAELLNDLKTEQAGRTFTITDWKNLSVSADRVYDAWVVAGDVEVRYKGFLSPVGDSGTVPQGEYVSVSIGERYLRHEDGVYTLSLSAGERRAVLEPPLLTPDMSAGIGVIPDYEDGGILIFHGYFGLFVYDLKAEKITFAADLKKAVGSDIIQGSEGAAVRVSADGHTIQLFYYPEQGEPKMAYTIDARIGSYTYGEYAPIAPCFSTPDELYGRFSGSTLGELAYTDGQKSFPLLSDWVWAD
ncbi:MAG: DUF5301 domain-containing protein [Bacillota bacterium]